MFSNYSNLPLIIFILIFQANCRDLNGEKVSINLYNNNIGKVIQGTFYKFAKVKKGKSRYEIIIIFINIIYFEVL